MMSNTSSILLLLSLTFLVCVSCDEPDVEPFTENTKYQNVWPDENQYYFAEHFNDEEKFTEKWVVSQAKKDDTDSKYDGEWNLELPQRPILNQDLGLVLKSKAKHAAIAARLRKPFVFKHKPFIVQYEVTLQEGQECGGSYLKLLSTGVEKDLKNFHSLTPYTIMFGPDKCGNDIKLHFILRYVNPLNGSITEKHCKKPKDRLEEPFKDKKPHLYKLALYPDNTFKISVDNKVVNEGHLLKDMIPAINPPKEIDDLNDFKPESWDEREKIADPNVEKPADWDLILPEIPDPNAIKPENWLDDEENMIADTSAIKPDDWDDEIDGAWEQPLIQNPLCENNNCGLWKPPMIPNPEYKGKWRAPLIDNPNYQGKWSPRKIQNPDFFEDTDPFSRITTIFAIGIELWSITDNILFDNIVICDDEYYAEEWAQQSFELKRKYLDDQSNTFWERMMINMNYKPGYYITYFIYCLIPVTIYIWYLWRRRADDNIAEESFVQKLKKIANDNPWIVAVAIVVVGLPISIILYMMCSASPKKLQGDSKKTDEAFSDDVNESQLLDDANANISQSNESENQDTENLIDDSEENKSSEKSTRKRKIRKE